jgi:Fe2+ or Zn2+ uptake regulation protein
MGGTLNANAQAVLDVVRQMANHPTAAEVYRTVTDVRPHMGLASVYRILHRLAEQGYIRELHLGDESCRYDARMERHDHAVCADCGVLLDIPFNLVLPEETLRAVAQAVDLELFSHELRIYGRCSGCQIHPGTASC